MAQIKEPQYLAAAIWEHVVQNPEDLPVLAQAESDILEGTMTLAQAQAHEFSDILVEE